jgi:hypothetical protein
MKTDKIIELVRQPSGKYKATKESIKILHSEKDDRVFYKKISKGKARSNRQLGYYWAAMLPTYCNHVDGMERLVKDLGSRQDYEIAHRWLTLEWASKMGREDLVQAVPTLDKNTGKIIFTGIVSMAFGNANNKDFNDYLEWFQAKFFEIKKVDLQVAIDEDSMAS